jgi:hypothetical protein
MWLIRCAKVCRVGLVLRTNHAYARRLSTAGSDRFPFCLPSQIPRYERRRVGRNIRRDGCKLPQIIVQVFRVTLDDSAVDNAESSERTKVTHTLLSFGTIFAVIGDDLPPDAANDVVDCCDCDDTFIGDWQKVIQKRPRWSESPTPRTSLLPT